MPDRRIELDAGSGGLVVTLAGSPTAEEMKATARQVWATQGFAGCYLVWDMRGTRFDLSAEAVRDLAAFAAESSPLKEGARMALVLAGQVEYGLARMLAAHRASATVEVTVSRDLDEALAWARQAPAALEFREGGPDRT